MRLSSILPWGGVSTSVEMQYHPDSAELTVRQTTRRQMTDEEHQNFKLNGPKPDIYPHLQMVVAFTISPEGQVKCVDFHASEHVEAAHYPAALRSCGAAMQRPGGATSRRPDSRLIRHPYPRYPMIERREDPEAFSAAPARLDVMRKRCALCRPATS